MSTARRATILLMLLAILVAPAASVVSMAATMPAMGMIDGDDGCKGCLPGKMTVTECGMVCISLPAVIAPVAAFSTGVERSPWCWLDEQVGRYPTKPPTGPPRSDG